MGGGTTVSFHVLPAAPRAQFQTIEFSGVETVTSYFLPDLRKGSLRSGSRI